MLSSNFLKPNFMKPLSLTAFLVLAHHIVSTPVFADEAKAPQQGTDKALIGTFSYPTVDSLPHRRPQQGTDEALKGAFSYPTVDSLPHPLVGPQRKLTADEELGGWYFCARQEINSYLDKHQPTLPENYRSAFSFFLKSDGTISDLKVLSSSGPAELDKALLEAIQQSFPLKQKFESTVTEIARNKNFRMDFSKSEHPTCRFKIIGSVAKIGSKDSP